jgi:ABC-type uncharacterized transport system involved in gliding motility auxiliary subunit
MSIKTIRFSDEMDINYMPATKLIKRILIVIHEYKAEYAVEKILKLIEDYSKECQKCQKS